MPDRPCRSLVLALALCVAVILTAGCAQSQVPATETPSAPPTAAKASSEAALGEAPLAESPGLATSATPTIDANATTDAPDPTAVPNAPARPTDAIPENLGLEVGASRLAAALGADAPGDSLHFVRTTTTDQSPVLIGTSPDGGLLVEIIGPEASPVTASLAALLPEGDVRASKIARQALYQTIGAAMPERAWAMSWLDERIDEAMAGTPFSATYEEHYVQIVRLSSPEPCIHLAITLAPRTLSLPGWDRVDAAAVDAWDRLPIMPTPVRGQHLPTDMLDLYEYTIDSEVEAVQAFYEAEMAATGWELVDHAVVGDPAHPEQDQIVLVYRRGEEGALVTIDPLTALEQSLVTLGYAEDAGDLPAIAG